MKYLILVLVALICSVFAHESTVDMSTSLLNSLIPKSSRRCHTSSCGYNIVTLASFYEAQIESLLHNICLGIAPLFGPLAPVSLMPTVYFAPYPKLFVSLVSLTIHLLLSVCDSHLPPLYSGAYAGTGDVVRGPLIASICVRDREPQRAPVHGHVL